MGGLRQALFYLGAYNGVFELHWFIAGALEQ
jgi:hypothetical protein